MKKTTCLALFAMIPAIGLMLSKDMSAYTTNGATWAQFPVPYSINTTNLDLPESGSGRSDDVSVDVVVQCEQSFARCR